MSNTFEILTRGLCPYGGKKWYEGDVQHLRSGDVVIRPKRCSDGLGYYVDPETVSFYAQRTDKNGKHVFVGDIVFYHDKEEDCVDLFVVEYDEENVAFCMGDKTREVLPSAETFSADCEVVGNKWQDKELYERIIKVAELPRAERGAAREELAKWTPYFTAGKEARQ